MRHFKHIMSLHFVEGEADRFVRFFQNQAANQSDSTIQFLLSQPRLGRGKYGSVDTMTLMVSVVTSAAVAALANGLVSILRDYLNHILSTRRLKAEDELARTKIIVSVGNRRVEVDQSSSETVWREILTALNEDLAEKYDTKPVFESPICDQRYNDK